jgi:hypothetical protein
MAGGLNRCLITALFSERRLSANAVSRDAPRLMLYPIYGGCFSNFA